MTFSYLTDTHCHLNLNSFTDELSAVVERASSQGIQRILVPGIDIPSSRRAIQLAEQYPSIFAAVGVHPGNASTWDNDSMIQLREFATHPKTVAIGEIGLDYYRDRSAREDQRKVFQSQLDLAVESNLPVVIHNREALQDLWPMLTAWMNTPQFVESQLTNRPGVLHSYDGDLEGATSAINRGFYIGISGPVTFRNAAIRQHVVANLPLTSLLLETDSPYLTPHPYRGKWPNEPAFIIHIAEKIAKIHCSSLSQVQETTAENAARLFIWE